MDTSGHIDMMATLELWIHSGQMYNVLVGISTVDVEIKET